MLATFRQDLADYVHAVFFVYTLLIIAYILSSLFFAFGGRLPYSRWSSAILGFLRDVCEPYLSIFRRFIPPIGPLDLSPIDRRSCCSASSARDRRGPHRRLMAPGLRGRAPARLVAVIALDQGTKALVRSNVAIGDRDGVFPGVELVHVRNEGVAFSRFAGGGTMVVAHRRRRAAWRSLAYFVTHLDKPLVWLPTGLLLGGALGNVIDRVRDGAVTDFIKLPGWPAFNSPTWRSRRRPRPALRHRAPARCSCARGLRTRGAARRLPGGAAGLAGAGPAAHRGRR